METLSDITSALEELAPLSYQDDWDNSGLQVGGFGKDAIEKVLVCLDVTEDVVDEAVSGRYGLIVSHHPLIFSPLRSVTPGRAVDRCVAKALKAGVAVYSAHTSLDNAPGGVNHRIASMLGLDELEWLEPDGDHGSGLAGWLPVPEDAVAFLERVKTLFNCEALRYSYVDGPLTDRQVMKVAVCGGSGSFLLPRAVAAGADCFITGDMSYHNFFTEGILIASIGHYESEQFTQNLLAEYLSERFPSLTVSITKANTNPVRTL